ncbi:MAG: hypothetical protein WA776_15610 [Xanthobacteraceae bacterium]
MPVPDSVPLEFTVTPLESAIAPSTSSVPPLIVVACGNAHRMLVALSRKYRESA